MSIELIIRIKLMVILMFLTNGLASAEPIVNTKENNNYKDEYFWSFAAPILSYGANRIIDWVFDDVLATSVEKTNYIESEKTKGNSLPVQKDNNLVGIVYRVYRVNSSGFEEKVNPDTVFMTGDRIIVKFMTNLPGILEVNNIDADKQLQHLGRGYMQSGRMAKIGPFEFYGTRGLDVLTLVLRPCTASEGIQIQDSLQVSYGEQSIPIDPNTVDNLEECTGMSSNPSQQLESLRIVEDQTIYSVVSDASLNNANILGSCPFRMGNTIIYDLT
jgi:hypothetical protein